MRILWSLLIFFCLGAASLAPIGHSIDHESFRVDNLGRMYVLQSGNLDAYDKNGTHLVHHSESLMSDITSIDRNSSLKMLVYYGDVPAFQILDNTLSPHSQVYDLNTAEMMNTIAVCMSANNTFWAYDGVSFELRRFDENYRILSNSGSTVLMADKVLDPIRMLESNGKVYIADSERGVYVFDQFGSYERLIAQEGLKDMDIENDQILLSTESHLIMLSSSDPIFYKSIDRAGILSLDISNGDVYLGDGQSIEKQSLNSLFD